MTLESRPVRRFRIAPVLPGDKSITHRAYLLGLVGEGVTEITGPNQGEDCRHTLAAVKGLGGGVTESDAVIRIEGRPDGPLDLPAPLDLGNSGTGLRLLLGLLAGYPGTWTLTGDASLQRRPVERVLAPLRNMGAEATSDGDHPPVTLVGGGLTGREHQLSVPSAQVKSALLLAGLRAEGETIVRGGGTSRDHTERLLPAFGVPVQGVGDWVSVRGPARLRAAGVRVPGDPSAAAFHLLAAAIVPGSEVALEGVSLNPSRTSHFQWLREAGLQLEVEIAGGEGEPLGRVVARGGDLRSLDIPPEAVPPLIDELPALAVAGAFAEGVTRVRGAGELKVKESNRLRAVAEGLTAIGAPVRLLEDGWEIRGSGGELLEGGEVLSHGDHRVAMAFLIAGLRCRRGVRIVDPPGIETSDPHFLSNLNLILEFQA